MESTVRNPLVAVSLSAVSPGLGHVYAGRIVPGLAFAGASVALGSFGALAVVAARASLRGVLVIAAGWFVLWVAAAIGAWRCAREADAPFTPREYNRWYVYAILAALAVPVAANWALAVRENVAEVFRVPSASMAPAIRPGAHVLVNKLAYRAGPVRRGDVIVFKNPNARYATYVKRVVALPGDEIEVRDGEVLINGAKLEPAESAAEAIGGEPPRPATFPLTKVPNGHCFVLGDNRGHSIDSREVGPVPLADIVGRVDRVW